VYQMTNTNGFEDKEWAATDLNPASPFANNLYCSWTRFDFGTEILLVRSTDEGITWSNPVSVSDESSVQGSFPAVGPNGELYVVWRHSGQMMFDKSTDGGVTFGTDIIVSNAPNAWFPHMAVDLSGGPRNGYIYVTWNDERNGDDDAFVCYSSDGGATWSAPIRVNNDPVGNGKIQYWPSVAISEHGEISILFYDTRNTPNNSFIEAYIARSIDGLNFTNELLSSEPSPTNIPNGDVRFGDYIAIDAYGGKVVPVWTDERAGGVDMDIYTAVVNPIVPVELTNFTARVSDGNTILEWSTATELNNLGFEIQRSIPQSPPYQGGEGEARGGWITIGFVEGYGTTTEPHNYSFTDNGFGGIVYYRLKQIDFDGTYDFSFVIEVNSTTVTTMDLEQNYPNPFNPNTNIKYQIGNDGFVSLEVFNSLGEVVATLINEFKQAGTYHMSFNASNLPAGRQGLPSGVYVYILKSGNFIQSKKMILLK
ncbi:MAG: T9SS type A sorting domain-containing protein, partial [Ignavibacteriaceae bacterium]